MVLDPTFEVASGFEVGVLPADVSPVDTALSARLTACLVEELRARGVRADLVRGDVAGDARRSSRPLAGAVLRCHLDRHRPSLRATVLAHRAPLTAAEVERQWQLTAARERLQLPTPEDSGDRRVLFDAVLSRGAALDATAAARCVAAAFDVDPPPRASDPSEPAPPR